MPGSACGWRTWWCSQRRGRRTSRRCPTRSTPASGSGPSSLLRRSRGDEATSTARRHTLTGMPDPIGLSPADYEKLGLFYLGRPWDLKANAPLPGALLYDSRDLVTHALCVGMTGSGKTGLGIALLEEAAIDGVPSLVIDPKGDLGNLLLTFPDLSPADFLPWVEEDNAARQGISREELAAREAAKWKEGLASWGEGGDRIRRLRDAAEVTLYTPGSTAGRPIAVLASLQAP